MIRLLARRSIEVKLARKVERARQVLERWDGWADAVVLGLKLPDGRGEELFPDIENMKKKPDLVILSEFLDEIFPEVTSARVFLPPQSIVPSSLSVLLEWLARKDAYFTLCQFARLFSLTANESEILALVANGMAPKQISIDCGCSVQSVYSRLARTSEKTGCTNCQEVLAKLFQFSCHQLRVALGTMQAA